MSDLFNVTPYVRALVVMLGGVAALIVTIIFIIEIIARKK